MKNETSRGVFLARPSAAGGDTLAVLRALASEEGFGAPEEYLSVGPGPETWDEITVNAELGENLLACARWRGVLEVKREK